MFKMLVSDTRISMVELELNEVSCGKISEALDFFKLYGRHKELIVATSDGYIVDGKNTAAALMSPGIVQFVDIIMKETYDELVERYDIEHNSLELYAVVTLKGSGNIKTVVYLDKTAPDIGFVEIGSEIVIEFNAAPVVAIVDSLFATCVVPDNCRRFLRVVDGLKEISKRSAEANEEWQSRIDMVKKMFGSYDKNIDPASITLSKPSDYSEQDIKSFVLSELD